jgi:hypothetical protein
VSPPDAHELNEPSRRQSDPGAGAQATWSAPLSRAADAGRIVWPTSTPRAGETAASIGADRIEVARADVTQGRRDAALMRAGGLTW